MILDKLPFAYVIYTEDAKVHLLCGIELKHEDSTQDNGYGLLPVYMAVGDSFDQIMSDMPKKELQIIAKNMITTMMDYKNNIVDLQTLIEKYNEQKTNNG